MVVPGREVFGLLSTVVDRESVDGAIIMTTTGSVLTTAGFDDPKLVAAITANVLSYLGVVGAVQTALFDAEAGVLAVTRIDDNLVALYSSRRNVPGYLVARLNALRDHLQTAY